MEKQDLTILVEKVSSGDKDAFLRLCEVEYPIAYYQSYSMLKNHHDAEDVVQNAMFVMYENIGKLRDKGAFKTWFQKLVNSQCLNYLRKRDNRNEHLSYSEELDLRKEDSKDWLPDANIEGAEFEEILAKLIRRLPDKQKRAIVLYYYEDLSYKEIAEAMDTNTNTVATNIKRGKEFLKKEMKALTDFNLTFDEEEQYHE